MQVAILFFLPRSIEDLNQEHDRGFKLMGAIASALVMMGFPFAGVVVEDLAKALGDAMKAPAFSERNCDAAGILSGLGSLEACCTRYDSSELTVTLDADGNFVITLCGVKIGSDFVRNSPPVASTQPSLIATQAATPRGLRTTRWARRPQPSSATSTRASSTRTRAAPPRGTARTGSCASST